MQTRLDTSSQQTTHATPPWYVAPTETAPPAVVSDVLEEYLCLLRQDLAVSETEAQDIVNEVRQHLLLSARGFEELGDAPDAALQNAISAFGKPRQVAANLTVTYQTTGVASALSPWPAVRYALPRLLMANTLTLACYFGLTCLSAYHVLSGAFVVYVLVTLLLLIAPALAGWCIGRSPQVGRAGLSTFFALVLLFVATVVPVGLIMILQSFVVWRGWQGWLTVSSILFALWIPIAPLAATIANTRAKRAVRSAELAR